MDLHNPDGIALGYGEGIGAALHDHNAGDQQWIDIVLSPAAGDSRCDAVALIAVDLISVQKTVYSRDGGVLGQDDWGGDSNGSFMKRLFRVLIRKDKRA